MLERGVRREHAVVWLNDRRRDLRRRIDGEFELRLFAVVDREALHEQRREAGARAAAERVEDEEALEAGAIVGRATNAIEHRVDDLQMRPLRRCGARERARFSPTSLPTV